MRHVRTVAIALLTASFSGMAGAADFTPRKVTATGAGGPGVDARFDLGRARDKGTIDTRSHYRNVEKIFADGGYIDDKFVLQYMYRIRNGRKREYWADWRSFATILANAELDADQVVAMARKRLEHCGALQSATASPPGNPEGLFNALSFVRFFGPKHLTGIIRDTRCKLKGRAPDVYALIGELAPETGPMNLPHIVRAAQADLGHTTGKPISQAEFQRRAEAWTRALRLAVATAKPDWTLAEHIAAKTSGYVLHSRVRGYDAMQGRFFAEMIRILAANGAEMNERVQFALTNNAGKPGSAKHTMAAILKQDLARAGARSAAQQNMAQLTDALRSGNARKARTFATRVVNGPRLPADEALAMAIRTGNAKIASQILGARNLIIADHAAALAHAVERKLPNIARQLASDDQTVATAIGKTREAARGKDLKYRYALAQRIATLGGPLAGAQLAAVKQELDQFQARAKSQREATRKKSEQKARQRAAQQARTRQAYLARKQVGQRVCQDVTIALGMLDVRLTAFVEQVREHRLQLRIHGTERQTVYYQGGRLRPDTRIWDAASSWADCRKIPAK